MSNHGFCIHDANKSKRMGKIISGIVSAPVIKIPSVTRVPPNTGNILYTIGGCLYYKSEGGTITLIAVN